MHLRVFSWIMLWSWAIEFMTERLFFKDIEGKLGFSLNWRILLLLLLSWCPSSFGLWTSQPGLPAASCYSDSFREIEFGEPLLSVNNDSATNSWKLYYFLWERLYCRLVSWESFELYPFELPSLEDVVWFVAGFVLAETGPVALDGWVPGCWTFCWLFYEYWDYACRASLFFFLIAFFCKSARRRACSYWNGSVPLTGMNLSPLIVLELPLVSDDVLGAVTEFLPASC